MMMICCMHSIQPFFLFRKKKEEKQMKMVRRMNRKKAHTKKNVANVHFEHLDYCHHAHCKLFRSSIVHCGMCIWWFCNFFSVCFAFVHAYNNLAYGFMQNYRVFCVICSDALLNADYCCVENEEQKSKYSLFSFISAFRLVWCACVFSL